MGLLDDTTSTKSKPKRSPKPAPSTLPSSGQDSATLHTIQSLRDQIAELDAKEEERGKLTTAQAAKLDALEAELTALKNPKPNQLESTPSEPAGRLAPWCCW